MLVVVDQSLLHGDCFFSDVLVYLSMGSAQTKEVLVHFSCSLHMLPHQKNKLSLVDLAFAQELCPLVVE